MILLLALLSAWPSDWYSEYSELNWNGMQEVSQDFEGTPDLLAARAISLYCTGTGDPLSVALQAVEADSGNYMGWAALALVEMSPDSAFMDSVFGMAFSLCPGKDPVLTEIHAYWLLTMEDYQGAILEASNALSADSGFGPAWLTLSMAYLDSGLFEEAMEASRISLERQPGSIPLMHQLAQALDACGLYDEAAESYSRVIELDPLKISAYADLGLLYENTKKDGLAVKTYRRLLEIAPEYAWAWGELAAVMEGLGRTTLADSFFTTAHEIDPSDPWVLYRLGRLRSRSDPDAAGDLLESAVALSPDFSSAWQELAFVRESQDNMAAAAVALGKCIDLAPEAWLYGELGYVLENRGLLEEAAQAYEAGIAMDSLYLYGWQRRGDIFLAQGDTLSAAGWFSDALSELESGDSWIEMKMGSIMAGRGMPDSASVFFSRVVEQDPENNAAWLCLARSAASAGDLEASESFLDSSLAWCGDTISILAERALILEDMGLREEAEAAAGEMLSMSADGWVTAGWSAAGSGFYRRAMALAGKAFQDPPADPWSIISLGELYGTLNRPGLQETCYEIAAGSPLRTPEHTVSIANFYFSRNLYDKSIKLLLEEYQSIPWDRDVATALAEAYLFDGQLDRAEEILLQVVEADPMSVYAICYLGLIQENRGDPEAAADRYLEALRLEPGYEYAEDRLLFISSEDYDPAMRRNLNRVVDWSLWLDLSDTGGNLDEQNFGGGGSISYNYGDGSSIGFETSGTAEIKNGNDLRRTAWASLSAEHFLTGHLYAGASTSWDRQPLTVRPWQVSSYLAAGWKSWPASWIWLSPETGAGLVNTRWSTSRDRTDEWTMYISLSIWAKTEVEWLPSLWLSGSVYIPPEDPAKLVASSVGELEFDLPGPVSLITGTSLDYTRTPVVESWENLDSEIYLRLRL